MLKLKHLPKCHSGKVFLLLFKLSIMNILASQDHLCLPDNENILVVPDLIVSSASSRCQESGFSVGRSTEDKIKVCVPTELSNDERDLFKKSFSEILSVFAETGIWITQKINPDTLIKLKEYLSNPYPQSKDKYMLDIAVARIYLLELVLREIRTDFCKMLDKYPLEVATVIPIISSKVFSRYPSLDPLLDRKNWKGYINHGKEEYLAYVKAPGGFF